MPFTWGGWKRMYEGAPYPDYYFDRCGVHPASHPLKALGEALDARLGRSGGAIQLQIALFQQPLSLAEALGHVICGLLPAVLSDWLLARGSVEAIFRVGTFSLAVEAGSSHPLALDSADLDEIRRNIVGGLTWFLAREVGQDPAATPDAKLQREAARLHDTHDPLLRLVEIPATFAPGPAPGGRLLRFLLEQGHAGLWPRPWPALIAV